MKVGKIQKAAHYSTSANTDITHMYHAFLMQYAMAGLLGIVSRFEIGYPTFLLMYQRLGPQLERNENR
jgi:hypothetical protein